MDYDVFCTLPGDKSPFPVEINSNKTVAHLKTAIQAEKRNTLAKIDADALDLYLINIPDDKDRVAKVQEVMAGRPEPLLATSRLWKVFQSSKPPEEMIHILVQLPPPPPEDEPDEQGGDLDPDFVMPEDFQPQVTFTLESSANWKATDLLNNNIRIVANKPKYITDLQEELSRKRLVTNCGAVNFDMLRPHLPEHETYFSFGDPSTDTLQEVTATEVLHYHYTIQVPMYQGWFLRNKESHIHVLLHGMDCHVNRTDKDQSTYLKFGCLWPFQLIVELPETKCKYTPKSDAALVIQSMPHLLLEIISNSNESDCNRMLLQAACLARLGNALRPDKNPFIVSAIYIDGTLHAKWHFVYQPRKSEPAVEFVVEHFDLQDATRRFDFVFRLYNFVALAKKDNATLKDPSGNVAKLSVDIQQMRLEALTSQKRKTRDDGDADDGPPRKTRTRGGPVENDILSDVVTLEALNRAGYTIPDELEGFELLLPLTAKMHHAVSADGKDVILKLTDEHEVKVLRYLHDKQSTEHTRIIPLLDVVLGRLIVLPLRTPLSHFLDLKASAADVEQLALQFLQGVAYLQQMSVAHLDLKPDNIVVRRDPESKEVDLAIIDFHISVFAHVEPTISASNGTPGWWAPEVSAGTPYNPLLADRWSCGRVLSTFTNHMEPSRMREAMRSFSQQLMDPEPSLRPPVTDLLTRPRKMRTPLYPIRRSKIQTRSSKEVKGRKLRARTSSRVVKT